MAKKLTSKELFEKLQGLHKKIAHQYQSHDDDGKWVYVYIFDGDNEDNNQKSAAEKGIEALGYLYTVSDRYGEIEEYRLMNDDNVCLIGVGKYENRKYGGKANWGYDHYVDQDTLEDIIMPFFLSL